MSSIPTPPPSAEGPRPGEGPPPVSGGYGAAPRYDGGAPAGDRDNSFALVSLISAVLSFMLLPLIGGVVAIVFGRKAQRAEAAGTADNGTLGVLGFWLGVVNVALSILALIALAVIITVGVAYFTTSGSTSP